MGFLDSTFSGFSSLNPLGGFGGSKVQAPAPAPMPDPNVNDTVNNPWAMHANDLQNNSSYLPDNYFVSGKNSGSNLRASQGGVMAPGPTAPAGTYPAMQNSFGLGSPPTPAAAPTPAPTNGASDPNFAVKSLSTAVSDSGSKGFNPWSMQGEANARTGQTA